VDYATFIATYPQFAVTSSYSSAAVSAYLTSANIEVPGVANWQNSQLRDIAVGFLAAHYCYLFDPTKSGNIGQIASERIEGEYSVSYHKSISDDAGDLGTTNFGQRYRQFLRSYTTGADVV
jgi:hypothetical protein